jgi:hypothetical protein
MLPVVDSNAGLEEMLLTEYGPYAPVSRIWRQLSYLSLDSARKSFARGLAPIPAVKLPGRRGTFVRTKDFAEWLAKASTAAGIAKPNRAA